MSSTTPTITLPVATELEVAIKPSTPDTTLPQLADPEHYIACKWDLRDEPEKRDYWLGLFRAHIHSLAEEAVREAMDRGESKADAQQRTADMIADMDDYLDEVTRDPGRYGRLDILSICWERERVVRRAGFADPYRLAKQRETDAAIALLPELLRSLDEAPDAQRQIDLISGVFAGNIFDLGATDTLARFSGGGTVTFHDSLDQLKPRPWFIDDLDAWLQRRAAGPYRSALLFVDNAGPDVTLGMIPLARDLLREGTRVILSANETPALNDITHEELVVLIDHIAAFDPVIRDTLESGQLRLLTSGNGAPLMDLTRISPALARAAGEEDLDLVVLEGMGRALETNFDAAFTCDVLKVCMIKDLGVAEAMGGSLYDLMMKFEPVGRG